MIFFKRLLILIGVVVCVVLIGNNTIIKTKVVYKGQEYQVRYLYSESQQSQGLSNINREEFQVNEIAFFVGKKYENKHFWMPNTYFDLDIFYFISIVLRFLAGLKLNKSNKIGKRKKTVYIYNGYSSVFSPL